MPEGHHTTRGEEHSTALVTPSRDRAAQLPIGLLVKTGELVPTRNDPTKFRPQALDHFRFADGDGRYVAEAERAIAAYGDQPTELDDLLLFSNDVADVLDIRIRAWGQSGVRIIGATNFAALPGDEYRDAIEEWTDEVLFFPKDESEVAPERRESWQGEAIRGKLEGPDDPRIERFGMRLEATLRFGLPRVLGLGKVALYSTTSRHNMANLRTVLWFAHTAFRGNLIGIHFRLAIRPRRARYFDDTERKRVSTSTHEVVLDTRWTLDEAREAMLLNRAAFSLDEQPMPALMPRSEIDDDERLRRVEEETLLLAAEDVPQANTPPEVEGVEEGEFEEPTAENVFAGIPTQTEQAEQTSFFETRASEALERRETRS